ncbi:MAG: hypothetical protein GKR97_16965 [Rhizobiaceae bacterium]|nr:hypothetical protein [Rhizobiaceae bacterium]
MTRPALIVPMLSLTLILAAVPVHASSLLELGKKPSKETIVSIGSAPIKKNIPLNLGDLRTVEAKLPPAPLTRSQRMALRAKKAASRQQQVTNARRRQRVAQQQVEYDEDEGFAVDGIGEPIME